ncbi:hypothetical protein [Seonamhaeicola aphaedonensis]|uniref:Uncharacterized protein n=1 Tax=Seonamhaeicola aphaedonensis TaxID=1461338 RepID=A0A3D9H8U3_9FLAO|nr:hypothetical protein [Seonamhaeicola aphaedonensis]RED45920.1 hypothetical protein DFQ02_10765 [Seonamhaeicola aphaedonensis]
MLTDKQSLILCGFMVVGIFVAGVLDILDNFIILTLLTITFLAIIINLVVAKSFFNKEEELEQ